MCEKMRKNGYCVHVTTDMIIDHGPRGGFAPPPQGGIFNLDFLIGYPFWKIMVYVTPLGTGAIMSI